MKNDILVVRRAVSPRLRLAFQLEAAFWLTRPQSLFSQVPLGLAAWSVGRDGFRLSDLWSVLTLIFFLASFQSVMFVVNDLYDARSDRISAPYMPIPSGLVTHRGALVEAIVLGGLFLSCIVLLSQDRLSMLLVVATLPAALATLKVYGATKSAWFSPLLGSTTFASAVLWCWLLAGRHDPRAFLLVFVIAALHGIHANIRAQLRDIEGDPKAGHLTMAARLGSRVTMRLAAAVRLFELLAVGILLVEYGRPVGWLWLSCALALFVRAATGMDHIHSTSRNRLGQTEVLAIWVYGSFAAEIAVLGALHPIVAAPTAIVMLVWYRLFRKGYYERMVAGYLVRKFTAIGAKSCA